VADRGTLSDQILDAILGAEFDDILSLPMRHSASVQKLLKETEGQRDEDPKAEEQFCLDESEEPLRYAVAYDPQLAERSRKKRERRLEKADAFIKSVLDGPERADRTPRPRGRPATVQGSFEEIHDYLRDRELERFCTVTMTDQGLEVAAQRKARKQEEKIDGKLVVESSRPDLSAQELISRHKELADIRARLPHAEVHVGDPAHVPLDRAADPRPRVHLCAGPAGAALYAISAGRHRPVGRTGHPAAADALGGNAGYPGRQTPPTWPPCRKSTKRSSGSSNCPCPGSRAPKR